jgi:hypothetical protein
MLKSTAAGAQAKTEQNMKKSPVLAITAATLLLSVWGGSLSAAAPPNGGTISIEPKTGDGNYDASTPAFVNAASETLAAKGFTILEDAGHAAYVLELVLTRAEVGTGSAKVQAGRAGVTPGGAFGSVGAGVVLPLSTGKSRLVPLQRTRLEMRIRKRGEEGAVWNGTAVTVRPAGTRKGADDVVASDLSQALLRVYPAEPEGIVGVP